MQHTKQTSGHNDVNGRIVTLQYDRISSPALEILRDFPAYLACLKIIVILILQRTPSISKGETLLVCLWVTHYKDTNYYQN